MPNAGRARGGAFPATVSHDHLGLSFTAVWRLYYDDLDEPMPDFMDALQYEAETLRTETG
jgi:hypothetical protein